MELSFLQLLWFILIIVLWIGYVTLEGFGLGTGMLLKVLPKNDKERRLMLNTIGPHWDGNEVWLLTAGGATFAAFPQWYATMFSGMYFALVAVLLCLIVRICAIEWRGKVNSAKWRNTWDWIHCVAAWVVSLLWGVAFANLVQGMKIEVGHYEGANFVAADPTAIDAALQAGDRHFLTGGFFSLLTPFTILGGLVVLTLFLNHGVLWTALKTRGDIRERALKLAVKTGLISTALTAIWALWAQFAYSVTGLSWIALVIAALLLIGALALVTKGNEKGAFFVHFAALAVCVVFIFMTTGFNALKSSIDPAYHLTLVQASATQPTHIVMVIAAVIFVPIVLAYTIWAYIKFSRRISVDNLPDKPAGLDFANVREFETAR
ncbi:MAG: cytochrome d ubiquinol oxidase subunit II [Actinomycetaceae bacterium]|nr:cytochrome d ubiquinol oxidase subunit II [Arcanobacterium sp.]MDD7505345.1 cytochrome d ubiquinol oxidase subunit II [Actinomycetaceae bacterium]MDY6143136.1 cytochrome d ubiquinol oxidase subunit II [Arcanobacterium sp.]